MWSGPIARITKNSTNWRTANQAWRRLTSSCESGKILTTVCALTKPWDILLPRNSCSSGNANLKRQSVTNLLDEYRLYSPPARMWYLLQFTRGCRICGQLLASGAALSFHARRAVAHRPRSRIHEEFVQRECRSNEW